MPSGRAGLGAAARAVTLGLTAAVALLTNSCKPLDVTDVQLTAKTLQAVGSTSLTGTVASGATVVAQVRVLDQFDEPLSGQTVSFSVSGGSVSSASVAANSQGIAQVTWSLPTTSGAKTLTASVPGVSISSVTFTMTLAAGAPASASVAPGTPSSNNQTGTAGQAVAVAPSIRVADAFGNGVPGVSVAFLILSGGGSLNNSSATSVSAQTGSTGIASMAWTLGQTVGTNTVRATATGLAASPVTFTATGIAGPAAKIVIAPGSPTSQGQSAAPNANVAVAPSVLVTDQNNNPVAAGVVVRFTVSTGGGKLLANASDVTGSNSLDITTTAQGIATVYAWRLGSTGANALSVTIPSISSVTAFTINATGVAVVPDFSITAFTAPSLGKLGSGISVSLTVLNAGTATSTSFRVMVYFSSNNILSTGDTPAASCTYASGLGAGASTTCSGTVNIPSLTAGAWFVGAIVDDLSAVTESNENNNTSSALAITLADANLAANGDFEAASNTDWIFSGTTAAVSANSAFSHGGTNYGFLGSVISSTATMYQDITIPAGAISPTLNLYTNITTNETTSTTQYDVLTLTVRNTSNTVLSTLTTLSNLNASAGTGAANYTLRTFSLSAYVGQTIRVYFNVLNDSTLPTTFRVDDVSVSWTAP